MMPSQKCGTDSPESATALAATSTAVPLRAAESTPAGMPMTRAMSIEQTASSTVTGSFEASSSVTGILLRSDSPRSPRSTLPIQIPYCTTMGRSRWYLARMAATTAGSLSSPAIAVAASPGRSFCSEKISTETKNSVGTSTATRRATYSASCISGEPSIQLQPPQADDAVRVGREAGDLRVVAGENPAVPEVDARHVAQEKLGGRVVELLALGRVGHLARLGQEGVHLSVAVVAVVLGALARVVGEDVAVGVRPPAPEGEVRLEVTLAAVGEHRDVLLRLDRHGDAGLGKHGLDDLRGLLPVALGRH